MTWSGGNASTPRRPATILIADDGCLRLRFEILRLFARSGAVAETVISVMKVIADNLCFGKPAASTRVQRLGWHLAWAFLEYAPHPANPTVASEDTTFSLIARTWVAMSARQE